MKAKTLRRSPNLFVDKTPLKILLKKYIEDEIEKAIKKEKCNPTLLNSTVYNKNEYPTFKY